jgi:hypothetical protein
MVAALLSSGCLSWFVPDYPPPAEPGSDASSPSDLAPQAGPAVPVPGDGGGAVALGFAEVQAGLDTKGCTSSACHGGLQTPQLKAAPATDADKMASFNAFKIGCTQGLCVNPVTPTASLVLQKPLAGSPLTHAGGKLFADFNDPVYVKWLAWIQAGAPY